MCPVVIDLMVVWFALWAIFWDKSDDRNQLCKLILAAIAIWAGYICFNPHVTIKYFVFTVAVVSFYFSYNWTTKNVYNTVIKLVWVVSFGECVFVVFKEHLIG